MSGRALGDAFPLRALVTRPRHQAGRLAARLRARGIGCLVEPMLEIVPLPWNAGTALPGRQAVLLTSPNAAAALLRAIADGAIGPAELPPVLAVGTATARPLVRAGVGRVEAAPGSNAADLLRLAQERLDPRGGTLAYLSGEAVACDLGHILAASGYTVERTVVYAAVPVRRLRPLARAAIAQGTVQVAPFLSARTATAFRDLLAEEGLDAACRGMIGVALSPRIAEAMQSLPWRALAIAARPDLEGLLAALDEQVAGLGEVANAHGAPDARRAPR